MVITGQHKLSAQALSIECRPFGEFKGMRRQEARGGQALQSGGGSQHNHVHLSAPQAPEGREALADQILVG